MEIVDTFECKIFLGLKEGYNGIQHTFQEAVDFAQEYCDNVGYGLTISPTKFVYKDGSEDGCVIGLINYPRFPSTPEKLTAKAIEIARLFWFKFNQIRVSVVCSDKTYMLETGVD